MVGCGQPPNWACGGDATTSEDTPASCAGTTFIITLEGYTALPPGTYSPTRSTGMNFSVTVPPAASSTVLPAGFCAACTARTRAMDSRSASVTLGSSSRAACSMTSAGTRIDAGCTPSNFSPYSSAASAPRPRTSRTSGSTTGSTESTSVPPRGRVRRSSLIDAVRPRRSTTSSMRKTTSQHLCFDSSILVQGRTSDGMWFWGLWWSPV